MKMKLAGSNGIAGLLREWRREKQKRKRSGEMGWREFRVKRQEREREREKEREERVGKKWKRPNHPLTQRQARKKAAPVNPYQQWREMRRIQHKAVRERGREMEEGVADGGKKVSKKWNPYLGRPSSGAQDLKGRQEHSQHRERDHGKVFCHIDTRASPERRMPAMWGGVGERGWGQEVRKRVGMRVHSKSISSTQRLQCFIGHTRKRDKSRLEKKKNITSLSPYIKYVVRLVNLPQEEDDTYTDCILTKLS